MNILYWLGLSALAGFLWWLGGEKNKSYRRVGVAIIMGVIALAKSNPIVAAICILAAFSVYSVGYGIQDSTDEGSALSKFYGKWFNWKYQTLELTLAVRITTGILYMLVNLILSIYLGHVVVLIAGLLTITGVMTLIAFNNFNVKVEAFFIATTLVTSLMLI